MKNFWYVNEETGEEFIVQAKNMGEAAAIMVENDFDPEEIRYLGTVSYEAAETMGVDIY